MKKHFVCMVLVCAMVLFGAGMSLAGNGNGSGSGNGAGDGTGPIHNIDAGIAFEYTGTVEACSMGGGLTLATQTGDVVLFGIGPDYYWESLGIGHPAVGDTLTASGYTVDGKNIVTKIQIEGTDTEVLLRDEDGKPKWRGPNGKSAGSGKS